MEDKNKSLDLVYLDNAATTFLHEKVLEAMMPFYITDFGNPSSSHKHGRRAKVAIDNARDSVAEILNVHPSEVFFTSGGTESNNAALWGAVFSLKISFIITSHLEHDSVYQTLKAISQKFHIPIFYLSNDAYGLISLHELEELLKKKYNVLVVLMHGNNEIGNIYPIKEISQICRAYDALFHCDCVQTTGKIKLDFSLLDFSFASASAHKFHGPKGSGLLYINGKVKISPYVYGGAQERNMRGGTENIAGIVGVAKALEIANCEMEAQQNSLKRLKQKFICEIQSLFSNKIKFNGLSYDLESSLHHIVNIDLGVRDEEQMILFSLDARGICVSAGSACSSGVEKNSRVISSLNLKNQNAALRISLSYSNTEEEISKFTQELYNIITSF